MSVSAIGKSVMEFEFRDRIYLPSQSDGVDAKEYLLKYIEREFPEANARDGSVYSVPRNFQKSGEEQAVSAEYRVFERLHGLKEDARLQGVWMTFFHSACYAGHSHRNNRDGKLMIREHDFVIFVKNNGKHFIVLVEVKSTHDENANVKDLEITSNAKVIKNNKRSAQHQLRDHLEVTLEFLGVSQDEINIQTYIMWPFLGYLTRDPKHNVVRRWKDEINLHVFENTLSEQEYFNQWFLDNVLASREVKEHHFVNLLNRYILLSCGVFVDEINQDMLALLNQEQLEILNSNTCHMTKGGPLVVHGAAGTGKTLLVLKKLEQLHAKGQLNERNRALYTCFWPGIRCEVEQKLESLGLRQYVDTARFYISQPGFLDSNKSNYKHIFMDEAEAICLSFETEIMTATMSTIFRKYRGGNCAKSNCAHDQNEGCSSPNWGELWFLTDMLQASLFLPKTTPQILKKPSIVLNKVMRSTGNIYNMFKQFYVNPMPLLSQEILSQVNIPRIRLGHDISGPPVYWVSTDNLTDNSKASLDAIVRVVIDLCATKGFKPNDICVIPFYLNKNYRPDVINVEIQSYFVENGFRPRGVGEIEDFLVKKEMNDFLISWVLKLKGIEFKVVVLVIDEDDYDLNDFEDRKKTYIMSSRCTCLLVIVSSSNTKKKIDLNEEFQPYPFCLEL